MLLNYIRPIEVIQVSGFELWFNTADLAKIFKVPASMIATKIKNKKSLLKGGKTRAYIDEATLLSIFNYDSELFKPIEQYNNTGQLPANKIMSTAEKVLRIGLIYRALALGPDSKLNQVISIESNTFVINSIPDPYGFILPDVRLDKLLV